MKLASPVKSIRKHCLECSGQSPKEVRLCLITHCPLYPYRMGENPNRKGVGGKPILNRVFSQKQATQVDIFKVN